MILHDLAFLSEAIAHHNKILVVLSINDNALGFTICPFTNRLFLVRDQNTIMFSKFICFGESGLPLDDV